MKIHIKSLEVETDYGRRTVQLAVPIAVEIDPASNEMPLVFHSLTNMFWDVVRKIAISAPEFVKAMSKAEA